MESVTFSNGLSWLYFLAFSWRENDENGSSDCSYWFE